MQAVHKPAQGKMVNRHLIMQPLQYCGGTLRTLPCQIPTNDLCGDPSIRRRRTIAPKQLQ